jgi:hypothetical protein
LLQLARADPRRSAPIRADPRRSAPIRADPRRSPPMRASRCWPDGPQSAICHLKKHVLRC